MILQYKSATQQAMPAVPQLGSKRLIQSLECLMHSSQNYHQKIGTLYSHAVYNIANRLSQ
jgi:hypothetical protein